MNSLLELRERMKEFYADYDVYIRPVLRFAIAITSFMAITNTIGYMSILNNLFVVVILAVIYAILPLTEWCKAINATLIVANGFGLSPIVGAMLLALYLLMVLLYFPVCAEGGSGDHSYAGRNAFSSTRTRSCSAHTRLLRGPLSRSP